MKKESTSLINRLMQKFLSTESLNNKAMIEKIVRNDKLVNRILGNNRTIDRITKGNKVLDKILSSDRAIEKILRNQKTLNKILSDEQVTNALTSGSFHHQHKNLKPKLATKQLLSEEKAKSLNVNYTLPSYLIGFPRSGTNFLQSVLEGSSELICRSMYGPPKANPNNILSLKSHTTSYEYLLDEISRFVPNTKSPDKFIVIIRDPRDVFISFYEFIQSTKGVSISKSDFISEVCYFFATFKDNHMINSRKKELSPLSILDAYRKHIEHWITHRPESLNCHIVKYEDLVDSAEEEFQKIFNFLELDCTLKAETLSRKVSQYSNSTRKRGTTSGWRNCQDQYSEIISSVNNLLEDEIKALGYAKS